MKIFKRIYYPVVTVLAIALLTLGLVNFYSFGSKKYLGDSYVKSALTHGEHISQTHNSQLQASQNDVGDYIETVISSVATYSSSETLDDDGKNTVDFDVNGGAKVVTYTVQKATLSQQTQNNVLSGAYHVGKTVKNYILAIPGTSGDAVLVIVPYDTSSVGGGADNSILFSAIEVAKYVASGKIKTTNDVVFLFADMSKDGGLGTYAFKYQFAGFNSIADRVKVAASFSANGTSGAATLFASSSTASSLVSKMANKTGGFKSSALELVIAPTDDFNAFSNIATVSYSSVASNDKYATYADSKASEKLVKTYIGAMSEFVSEFATANLDNVGGADAVYFSYLNLFTISFPVWVGYIFAGILLALLIAIIVINKYKKSFGLFRAIGGAFIQLLTLVATLVCLFAVYFIVLLILSGFGVITINSILSLQYMNAGIIVAGLFLAFALSQIFYIVFKRTFLTKATDVVRGNVLLFALLGFVLAFVAPKIAYPFYLLGLLELIIMLVTTLTSEKFKTKFDSDIHRLFLYIVPVVLLLPLIAPLVLLLGAYLPLYAFPLILTVAYATFGFIAPYGDYLKPVLDKFVKKLPARTVRIERTVTERVEDKAKKGKFTEVTSRKIIKEKVAWNYAHGAGIAIVSVLSVIVIILCSSFGSTFSQSLTKKQSYDNSIYDNSMLYVYEQNGSSSGSGRVEVYDHEAYRYIQYAVRDLKWDGDRNAYTKTYSGNTDTVITTKPAITVSGDNVTFTTFDGGYSTFIIKLTSASSVTEVTFGEDETEETFTFKKQDEITFNLLSVASSQISFNVIGNCSIEITQMIDNGKNLEGLYDAEWSSAVAELSSNADASATYKSGIVIKCTQNK